MEKNKTCKYVFYITQIGLISIFLLSWDIKKKKSCQRVCRVYLCPHISLKHIFCILMSYLFHSFTFCEMSSVLFLLRWLLFFSRCKSSFIWKRMFLCIYFFFVRSFEVIYSTNKNNPFCFPLYVCQSPIYRLFLFKFTKLFFSSYFPSWFVISVSHGFLLAYKFSITILPSISQVTIL